MNFKLKQYLEPGTITVPLMISKPNYIASRIVKGSAEQTYVITRK
jgi:hypothetical protein